jgi:hypothetical protein
MGKKSQIRLNHISGSVAPIEYSAAEQREFFEAEASRAEAIVYLVLRKFGLTPALKKYSQSPHKYNYELAKKKALVFLRCAYDLQQRGITVFKNSNLRHAVKEALRCDDLEFFKAVGRALGGHQVSVDGLDEEAFAAANKLETFLITSWTEEVPDNSPPLCFLSINDLAKVCHEHGIHPSVHEKTIYTTWKRLGLRGVKGFKFRGPGLHHVSDP